MVCMTSTLIVVLPDMMPELAKKLQHSTSCILSLPPMLQTVWGRNRQVSV